MKIILTAQERQQLIKELQEGDQTMGKFWQLLTRVSDSGQVASWVPWTDAITPTEFATNTGLTVLSVINPQDSATVQLGVPDVTQIVEDKSSWNADMNFELFDNNARLVNLGTTNGIKADSSIGVISAIVPDLPGAPITTPFIVAYCFDITRTPTSNETLFSFGNATVTGAYLSVDVTSNRYIQYNYKDASANTLTKTSTTAIPLDTKLCLVALFERTKIRIFLHGGSFDTAVQISDEGSFNTGISNLLFAVNCRYMDGATTQQRTSGYYYGSIIASGITTKSFDVVRNSCLLFKVPHTSSDLSTLDNGLISLIQGPGAGSLATPKADVLDLITGMVFTATGTQPAATTGKFHNAMGLAMTASTVYMKGTVPAIWNIYSGSYGDYTIYVRHKTGTLDASTRNIFCLNDSAAPSTQNIRLQQSTTNTFQWVVDNAIKATSTITLASDTWYDFVIKGSSGTHTFSCNGETPISFTPGTRSALSGYFGLGGHFTAATTILHPGRGHLDCLALWNRALTNDEIIQLRKGGNGLDGMFNYITQYDGGGGPPPSVVNEYRGTQLLCTNNNNVYLTSGATSGATATYLSFKPPRSGRIRKVSLWWKGNNSGGYSAGNGGTYTLSIRTDNGSGAPSATVVAEQTGITGWTLSGTAAQMNAANIRTTTLTTQNSLVTKGVQYHMLIVNTNGSPAANYISLNTSDIYVKSRAKSTPTASDTTIFALHAGTNRSGTSLSPNEWTQWQGAPNVVFHLDKDDNGTTDFWWGFPSSSCFSANTNAPSKLFGGTTRIRQILPIESGDNFTITKIWLAANRQGSPGDLTVRILASDQTTVLGTTTITQAQYTPITPGGGTIPEWGSATFSSPVSITGGSTYYLELYSPTGGSSNCWWPVAIQDLHTWMMTNAATDLGFSGISGVLGGWYGSTGKLQMSTNSGSSYSDFSTTGGSGGMDLGWYFEVTVP